MIIELLIFLIILIIIILHPVLITPGGILSGITKDEAGNAVGDVALNLIGDSSYAVTSDAEGKYAFPKALTGSYILKAQKDSQDGSYYYAEYSILIGNENQTLDVTLENAI